jgi:hypothetical protein
MLRPAVPLVFATILLCGCSTTFRGRVVRANGQPVKGAFIEAAQYPSFLGCAPWQWFAPARYVRGMAKTGPAGEFTLRAASRHIDELHVQSAYGFARVSKPSSGRSLIIKLHPN